MTLSLLQVRSDLTLYNLPVTVQVNSFLKTIKFLHMSHLLSLHLLTLDADSATVQRYSEGEISSFKHFLHLYVTLTVPTGNTFFISGSPYKIWRLSFKIFSKFFITGLYTVIKLKLDLITFGLTCLASCLLMLLIAWNCLSTKVKSTL